MIANDARLDHRTKHNTNPSHYPTTYNWLSCLAAISTLSLMRKAPGSSTWQLALCEAVREESQCEMRSTMQGYSPGSCMSCMHILECVNRTLTFNHHSVTLCGEYVSDTYSSWRSVEFQSV